jgi:hypothetical protein
VDDPSTLNKHWQDRIGWPPPSVEVEDQPDTPALDAEETVPFPEEPPVPVDSPDMDVQASILISKNAKEVIAEVKSGLWDGFRDLLLAKENERAKPRKTVIATINTLDNL